MGGLAIEVGCAAPDPKRVPEGGRRREGNADIVDQECLGAVRRLVENDPKTLREPQRRVARPAIPILVLPDRQPVTVEHPPAGPVYVGNPLAEFREEYEAQARLRADRVRHFARLAEKANMVVDEYLQGACQIAAIGGSP